MGTLIYTPTRKFKPHVLGPELLNDRFFNVSPGAWALGTGWTISGGKAVAASGSTSGLEQDISASAGKNYLITFTIEDYAAGDVSCYISNSGAGTPRTANGTYTEIVSWLGSTNTKCYFYKSSDFDGKIDNVSCREILEFGHSTSDELIINGSELNRNTVRWQAGNSAILSVVSGQLKVLNGATATGYAYQEFPTVPGRTYKVTCDFDRDGSTSTVTLYVGKTNATGDYIQTSSTSASGSFSETFVSETKTAFILIGNADSTINLYSKWDNISVKLSEVNTYELEFKNQNLTPDYDTNMDQNISIGGYPETIINHSIETYEITTNIISQADIPSWKEFIASMMDNTFILDPYVLPSVELVTNGTFDTGTGSWAAGDAASDLSIVNSQLKLLNTDASAAYAYQAISTVVGKIYKVGAYFERKTAAAVQLRVGTTAGAGQIIESSKTDFSGIFEEIFAATSSVTYISMYTSDATNGVYTYWDDISVKLDVFGEEADEPQACFATRKGQITHVPTAGEDYRYRVTFEGRVHP